MPRKVIEELERVHIWLAKRDIDRIDAAFGKAVKRSEAIRLLIRATLDQIDAKAAASARSLPVPKIDFSESTRNG